MTTDDKLFEAIYLGETLSPKQQARLAGRMLRECGIRYETIRMFLKELDDKTIFQLLTLLPEVYDNPK